jgi:hypothetical protein
LTLTCESSLSVLAFTFPQRVASLCLMWSASFAFSDGFNSSPLPFECEITPRSAGHERVMREAYEEAIVELAEYTPATNKVS